MGMVPCHVPLWLPSWHEASKGRNGLPQPRATACHLRVLSKPGPVLREH
jgi:hypothetical protein